MKAYVQYLEYSAVDNTKLIESCGDRAVFILDGRNSLYTWVQDAIKNTGYRRPRYPHFKIMRGNFRQSFCIYDSSNCIGG